MTQPTETVRALEGRIAVVTGAGQGVGRGIAIALARAGAGLFLVGRTAAKLDIVADELRAQGARAATLAVDIAGGDAADRIVAAVTEEFGGVDILVNNANVAFPVPLADSDDSFFRDCFEAGPRAALSLMRAVRPVMAGRGGGVIINLATSAAVRWDAAGYGVYSAIKEAQRALTRTAAHEWARDGIRALSVAPHAHSPGLDWWIENNPEEAEEFVAAIPAGRIGDPVEDVGVPVAWLCSDEARYLTGATIPLDGGQSRWG
ncbi:MAG TPA: SDR family oxidoreductase [Actinomycetales bacterium]|nr:SDR family oxidoreductase [Actinomycetales bacterium]